MIRFGSTGRRSRRPRPSAAARPVGVRSDSLDVADRSPRRERPAPPARSRVGSSPSKPTVAPSVRLFFALFVALGVGGLPAWAEPGAGRAWGRAVRALNSAATAAVRSTAKPPPALAPLDEARSPAAQFIAADGAVERYPASPRSPQVDRYADLTIPDPYRWLEDAAHPRTRPWIDAQQSLTRRTLDKLPGREALRRRLVELTNHAKRGLPEPAGDRLFLLAASGRQSQPTLCRADRELTQLHPVVDLDRLDPSGRSSLCGWAPSPDGRLVAYGVARDGSDRHVWRVRDVETGVDLPETLGTLLFAEVAWAPTGDGFYYAQSEKSSGADGRDDPSRRRFCIRWHRTGEPAAADRVMWESVQRAEWACDVRATDDGRWLVVRGWTGLERRRRLFCLPLDASSSGGGSGARGERPAPVELTDGADADYQFVGASGDRFWFQTDRDAPRGRVVEIDRRAPSPDRWREIVPESADVLQETTLAGDRLFVRALREVEPVVRIYGLDGRAAGQVELPGGGSVRGFRGRSADRSTYYVRADYASPPSVWRYDLATGRSEALHQPEAAFDPDEFETTRVHYVSLDGTRIPMTIAGRRGRTGSTPAPTLLYGYGGFHLPMTPTFSATHLAWLEMGGLLAVPHLRGGGEFGRDWHDAGRGAGKSAVVDDFLAAARWLIDERYADPDRLAIRGGSNGGLLVGAALARRPDLFAAAVPSVGLFDMLRYHRLPRGATWSDEYGTADDPQQFRSLLDYSPLHNLRPGAVYPAVLVMTGLEDDRVVPAHSFKFAAALQNSQAGTAPCLLRVERRAGHGAGASTGMLIDAGADMLAFLKFALRIDP